MIATGASASRWWRLGGCLAAIALACTGLPLPLSAQQGETEHVYPPSGPLLSGPSMGTGDPSAAPSAQPTPLEPPPSQLPSADELERIIQSAPTGEPQPAAATAVQAPPDNRSNGSAPMFRGSPLSPQITWRVENPFRLFSDPKDTEVHRATYLSLSGSDLRNPVLAIERALAARHRDGWAAPMVNRTCWNDRTNKYTCDDRGDYLKPRSHAVVVELGGIADASATECAWRALPHGDGAIAPASVVQPCDQPLSVDVPYPAGTEVIVSVGGVELQRAEIAVHDLLIVGMGDSFASGEGNPDVPVHFSRERAATYGDAKYVKAEGGRSQR